MCIAQIDVAQLFSRPGSVNINILLAVFILAGPAFTLLFLWVVYNSPWRTLVGKPLDQPVPFSHEHHVAGLGIDCRYCHTSVETAAFAGIPPVHTCMTCHSQVWRNATVLAPIRESYISGIPLHWTRVYDLPQFVFFNHSAHLNHGIGCSTCHGRVDQMQITVRATYMQMRWCVHCHQDPALYLRPRDQVMNMAWVPPPNQVVVGHQLLLSYHIDTSHMMDCVTCHR